MSLPILCYHNVAPLEIAGRRLNIEPAVLESHIRHFKRKRLSFVRAGELIDSWPEKAICLTFDDAYESMLQFGTESMQRHGAVASIYAVTSLIGSKSTWDVGNERPLANLEQLLKASRGGFEIGNHTASHADLSALTQDQQRTEIEAAHLVLSAAGMESASIAYPFGKFNGDTEAACRSVGIGVGLALSRRAAISSDKRYALPRIVVGYGDHLPKLLYKIHLRPYLPVFRKRQHYV